MEFFVPEYAKYALDKLKASGFEAYLVGGCVRDVLMGRTPFDYDITTSALPAQTMEVFKNEKKITSGMKHGTVAPIIGGRSVEITTFRVDGEYKDMRRPSDVKFTRSLTEDLARRDFTMNAVALGADGEIFDPYGGREDIKKKVIRAVGKADKRFCEDALRIMRGLRFSAVLGFEVEEETLFAMRQRKELLKFISAERIYAELTRLLSGKNAHNVLLAGGVLPPFAAEAAYAFEKRNDEERCDNSLSYALFFGDAERAKEGFCRLKADRKTRDGALFLLRTPLPEDEGAMRLFVAQHGACAARSLLSFHALKDEKINREEYFALLSNAEKTCVSPKELALDGSDVKKMGFSGSQIGEAMGKMLSAVNFGECENTPEALLKLLSESNFIHKVL